MAAFCTAPGRYTSGVPYYVHATIFPVACTLYDTPLVNITCGVSVDGHVTGNQLPVASYKWCASRAPLVAILGTPLVRVSIVVSEKETG